MLSLSIRSFLIKPKIKFSKYLTQLSTPQKYFTGTSEFKKDVEYTQGQYVDDYQVQEYFYYLNQDGELFLDDTKCKTFASCYKEQKFLQYFFQNLRLNTRDRYLKEFPYVSLSGSERNYLRCEDLPFVITQLDEKNDMIHLNQIHSAHWAFHFDPERLFHNIKNERLYYLFEDKEIILSREKENQMEQHDPRRLKHLDKLPCRIALVKSDISIRLMKKTKIILDKHNNIPNKPSYKFEYKSKLYDLNNDLNSKAYELFQKFSLYGKCKSPIVC